MTSPLWGKYCDGGHYCSAPKECCSLGCCYHTLPTNGVLSLWFLGHWYFWALVMAAVLGVLCACSMWRRCWRALRMRNACSCCGSCSCSCSGLTSGRDERASEPDSTGSCYAPPHYSRCNSFHHAPPPPYAEVTSKPDLYPLVISYNGETGMKRGGSASYLMVQYFRNYILRPSGSISATSTIDSLSSSFICNAANEANTVIPPPYSCTGSLEGFTFTANSMSAAESQMIRSTSSLNCNEYQQSSNHSQSQQQTNNGTSASPTSESPSQYSVSVQNSPKYQSNRSAVNSNNSQTQNGSSANSNGSNTVSSNNCSKPVKSSNYSPVYVHNKTTSFINNLPNNSNSRLELEFLNETVLNSFAARIDRNNEIDRRNSSSTSNSNSNSNPALQFLSNELSSNNTASYRRQIQHSTQPRYNKKGIISNENSMDSETSQGDEHNFSELLNLSVCAPSSIINMDINNPLSGIGEYDATGHNMAELQQSYSIANSVTVSDISSLANLGTPDSPPRATSPTIEIRELLDKIQQLPQQKSPAMDCSFNTTTPSTSETQQSKSSRFFKNKSKTLYMPLNTTSTNKHHLTQQYSVGKISPSTAKHSGNIFSNSGIFSYAGKTTKGWLSRSAPATPCGNFVPLFPSSRERKSAIPKSHMGSKSKMDDASALLTEFDGSDGDDEPHNNRNEQL